MKDDPHQHAEDSAALWRWVFVIAAGYFALHIATATRYGYFRDALYYIACSYHLDFGDRTKTNDWLTAAESHGTKTVPWLPATC